MSGFQEGFNNASLALDATRQGMDYAQQQRDQQTVRTEHADAQKHQKMAQIAAYLVAAPAEMRPQIWQQVAPQFNAEGLPVPPQWDDSLLPLAQQYAQAWGVKGQDNPESWSNAGNGFLTSNRGNSKQIPGFSDAAKSRTRPIMVPDGKGGNVLMQYDPDTQQVVPMQYGQQNAPQRVQFDFAAGTDPETQAAMRGAQAALQPGAQEVSGYAPAPEFGGMGYKPPPAPRQAKGDGAPPAAENPATEAAQVKALAEGRMAFPTGTALKSPYWQNMLAKVAAYDPTFDAVNYNARAKTRSEFTSGKSANNIKALNTLAGHIAGYLQSANKLDNTQYPLLNKAKNSVSGAMGNPQIASFEANRIAIANELTTVFRGSSGNEADVQSWLKQLDNAKSPEQFQATVKKVAELVESRIAALREQYKQGMGTTKADRPFVTPANQKFFDALEGKQAPKPEHAGFKVLD